MKETNEAIQAKIDELEQDLRKKKREYKLAFEMAGGWDEAKILHKEIISAESEIELLKNRLKD